MSSVVFSPNVLSSVNRFNGFLEANRNADKKRILFPLDKREIISQYMNDTCNNIKSYLAIYKGIHRERTPFDWISFRDSTRDWAMDNPSFPEYTLPFSKKDVLARAHNYQRLDTPDIYMQKPIPLSRIKNQKIMNQIGVDRWYYFDKKAGKLNFYHDTGVCQGESLWFTVLYFESKKNFPDTPKGRIQHIRAVTNLFSRGAPRAASFIQTIYMTLKRSCLFGVQEIKLLPPVYYKRTPLIGIRVDNLDQLAKQIMNLSPGVYDFGLAYHSTIYIKIDEKQSVFFDPNKGSFLVNGEQGEKKLAEYILKHYGTIKSDGNIVGDFILKDRVLLIKKLIKPADLSKLEKQKLYLESVKINFLSLAYFFTFPLRLCIFWTVLLVKNIFERTVHCINNRQLLGITGCPLIQKRDLKKSPINF